MAYKSLKLKVRGCRPMIMHSGQTADPLNEFAKRLKKVSAKRTKTEADIELMAEIEFMAGLYIDKNKKVIVPAENILACLINAGKRKKLGKQVGIGIDVEKHSDLEYDGVKDPKKLWGDKNFVFRKAVTINRVKVMRTRPIFNEWGTTFYLRYNDTKLDEETVIDIVKIAGAEIGLGDWRPQYGLFEVVE
jgi:hypothetical protein